MRQHFKIVNEILSGDDICECFNEVWNDDRYLPSAGIFGDMCPALNLATFREREITFSMDLNGDGLGHI